MEVVCAFFLEVRDGHERLGICGILSNDDTVRGLQLIGICVCMFNRIPKEGVLRYGTLCLESRLRSGKWLWIGVLGASRGKDEQRNGCEFQ